jgi:DNA-binding LacI/PurR family transcriptional regulator
MAISICQKKFSAKEIAADIKAFIADAGLTEHTELASPKRLALKYNVAPITVNRAIGLLVTKGIVYRVKGKGTFVAERCSRARNKLAGYLPWQHHSGSPFNEAAFGTFEKLLVEGLKKRGIEVEIAPQAGFIKENLKSSDFLKYDLLIIPSGMVAVLTPQWLERLAIPVIVVSDSRILDYPFNQVCHYYEPGFERGLRFIKEKGYNNISIAGIAPETSQSRAKVLHKVAERLGVHYEMLPFDENCLSMNSPMIILAGREQGKYFLEKNLDGVIFCLSDFLAWGIIDVINERGLELGKDVKLISYDNLESRAPFNSKEAVITSITHPLTELAIETVKLADDIVTNGVGNSGVYKIVRVPAKELVIRKSFY